MTNQILRKVRLLLLAGLLCTGQMWASDGKNGTVKADVAPIDAEIGGAVALSVTVSGMSDGTAGGSNGDGKYSITIPAELLNADGSEVTEKNVSNDLTDRGGSGNGVYQHGEYTSHIPGIYTFGLNVETGSKEGSDPSVTFHPLVPAAQPATAVGLREFTASWQAAEGADAYEVTLTGDGENVQTIDNVTELSHTFTDLIPGTAYSYTVRSKAMASGIFSLASSESIDVTTTRPVLTSDDYEPFPVVTLGQEGRTTVTVAGTDLLGDIQVRVEPADEVFRVDKESIGKDDENKEFEVTFAPKVAGLSTAELVLSSDYALDLRIPLSATASLGTPTALEATDVQGSAFTAQWGSVDFAESYRLTVLDATETPLEDYDGVDVGNVTSYKVAGLLPNTTYTYVVAAVNNGVLSEMSNSIKVTTLDGAVITHSKLAPFVLNVNETAGKTMRVSGNNLTGKIALSLSDDTYFTIDKNELEAEGGEVYITYAPTAVGVHEATLTLSSESAADVTVLLNGSALPLATVAMDATAVTDSAFVANWEARETAADYLFTLVSGTDTLINNRSTGLVTSLVADTLQPGTLYRYTVKVVEAGLVSAESNAVEVYTHAAPQPVFYPERDAIRVTWAALPMAEAYLVSLFAADAETPLESYNRVQTTATEFTCSGLAFNTAYVCEVIAVFGENEYTSGRIATATTGYYGAQLRNTDFETWDNLGAKEEEPTNWNSFMTAGGSQAGGITGSFVKVQKVKSSSTVLRPRTKGSNSASFWSTETMGIIANGNLTTGQIQANSTTATDVSNHNKTLTGDDAFRAPFTDAPDSLTIWTRFVPKTEGSEARVSAVLHDNYDYHDPNKGDIENHAVSKAVLDYKAAPGNSWQRLSIPFVSTGSGAVPAYMLVSLTTNKTPGQGAANDSVYVDDILMVYKPSVRIEKTDKNKYVLGDVMNVSFELKGTMSPYNLDAAPNVVYLELSAADGTFEQARRLAELTTDYSGVLTAQLPEDLEPSANYRVRVVTTNYPMVSAPSEPLAVRRMPATPVALEATQVTAASFVANWQPAADATGYMVTVAGKDYVADGAETTSLEIKGLTPETEYSYVVKATADELVSPASNAITVKTASGGSIIVSGNTTFATTVGEQQSEVLAVTGVGLIEDIAVSLLDNEAGLFAINAEKLGVDGGNVTVTYTPQSLGTHTARLLLKSAFVDNVMVELVGNCLPASVSALDATDITPVSFTACWEASSETDSYLLSVYHDGQALAGYNGKEISGRTTEPIDGLTPGATYTYDVCVKSGDLQSAHSNEMSVILPLKPQITNIDDPEAVQIDLGQDTAFRIQVQATDLFDPAINVVLSPYGGTTDFVLNTPTLAAGEELVVAYRPTEAGEDTTFVSLSSVYADEVQFMLVGIARPLPPVALNATEVTFESFVARWEATDADACLLTVKDSRDRIVNDYDRKDVGTVTSEPISGLKRLNNYTYYVEVRKNGVLSLPSNVVEVRTVPSQSGVSLPGDAAVELYPNPTETHLIVTGVPLNQNYLILDTKGLVVTDGIMQGNEISVEHLPSGIYMLKTGSSCLPFIKK